MKYLSVAASMALVSSVCAAPNWADWIRPASCPDVECPVDACVQQSDADAIVDNFIAFLDHPNIPAANITAQDLLAEGFYEKSDSINLLAGKPVGSITFQGKQAYIGAVLSSPRLDDIEILKVLPAGCNNVIFYWRMGVGSKQIPVQGFNLFEIDEDYKIANMMVEFNNIGWGIDIGYSAYNPGGQKLPTA